MREPIARYERTRYLSVAAIQLLTVVALWGQWHRLAIVVATGVVAGATNRGLYAWVRRTRRFDAVDDIKNSFNAVVVAATGHLCGWPLPVWLFVPMNALWFGARTRSARWKMLAFALLPAVTALADGVAPLLVASILLLTAVVFHVAEVRDEMLALRTEELAAANDALAEAQSIALVGSFRFDAQSGALAWSQQLQRICGVDATPTAEGFFALIHQEDRDAIRRGVAQAMQDGQPFAHEYRLVRPDGDVRWIHSRGQVVSAGDGRRIGMRGIAQDVTDKKKLHARLLLTDRLTSLGTLAGGIAHEINNPLSYVIANLEYIGEELRHLRGPSTATRIDELDIVVDEARQGADRVRDVVRDLRSFARDDSRQDPAPQVCDLDQVLGFALKMASNEIRHRARLINQCPALPPVAASDSRLGQVLLNLLVNAAQAIPEGDVDAHQIRVSASVDQARRVAVVEIADTGCGMAPQVQATIFDPFFTTKPVGSGMGLGLSICHSIVSDFGGEIAVKSELGKGSTFSITVPLAPAAAADPAPSEPAAGVARRGRILIVDDDPFVAASLRRMLNGHEVELASGGEDALARLAAAAFDVVLCDLLMPGLTGMDVYDRLHAGAPDVAARMVFMTGGAFTARAREFLERVPNARFDKPADHHWLRAFVGELVERRIAA